MCVLVWPSIYVSDLPFIQSDFKRQTIRTINYTTFPIIPSKLFSNC